MGQRSLKFVNRSPEVRCHQQWVTVTTSGSKVTQNWSKITGKVSKFTGIGPKVTRCSSKVTGSCSTEVVQRVTIGKSEVTGSGH